MINETTLTTGETTAYALGTAIGILIGLQRMVEQNMTDYGNNLEGVTGLHPMWSKVKLMSEFNRAIATLDGIKYPYKS